MSLLASLRRFAFLLVVLTVASSQPVAAQAIPDNIPDGSDSHPEEQREELKERHRDIVSRFFTGGQFSAAPAWAEGPSAFGFQLEAGFDVGTHDAIYLSFGAREYVERMPRGDEAVAFAGWADKEAHVLFSANYEMGIARYMANTAFARRTAVSMGIGLAGGEGPGMLSVEVGPEYTLPIDQHWSLPIGLKLGQTVIGAGSAQLRGTFVGLSIGIKRFYGHRPYLR